jgi:hypothetical protein
VRLFGSVEVGQSPNGSTGSGRTSVSSIPARQLAIEPTHVGGFRPWLWLNRCIPKGEQALRFLAPAGALSTSVSEGTIGGPPSRQAPPVMGLARCAPRRGRPRRACFVAVRSRPQGKERARMPAARRPCGRARWPSAGCHAGARSRRSRRRNHRAAVGVVLEGVEFALGDQVEAVSNIPLPDHLGHRSPGGPRPGCARVAQQSRPVAGRRSGCREQCVLAAGHRGARLVAG